MAAAAPVSSRFSEEEKNAIDEWKETRGVMARFDEKLHDLRKTGFSFVTALLTAQALLEFGPLTGGAVIPDHVKLSVIVVTWILIAALQLAELNNRFYQQSTVERALILERLFNLGLSQTISELYKANKVWRYVRILYTTIAFATGVLGIAILSPGSLWLLLQVPATFAVPTLVYALGGIEREPTTQGYVDWTVTPLTCALGDAVRISLTNLDPNRTIEFPANQIAWAIREPNGTQVPGAIGRATAAISLGRRESYDWIWNVPQTLQKGIYLLHPRDEAHHLQRKIWVK